MLYAGSPLANWRVIFTLVYYGRTEVIMISDIALLKIYNQYNNTARKNDYVILPFNKFPVIDNRLREFEWYAFRLETLISADMVFVNYSDRAVILKRSTNTMNAKWTIEIPYGKRNYYIELIYRLNRAVTLDGAVTLFVSNNPYDLCAYICLEDVPENSDKINEIITKSKVKIVSEKGIDEFFNDIRTGRRFNVKYIPANIDKRHIELIFKNTFLFSEESALKELGYNSSVNYKRKKLFVSYSHANKKIVYSITDKLENYGINLWIDKKSIEFGDNITRSICSGINESDLAILFLSKEIIDSNFSQFELENIISNMIKKSMGWFIVKLDDVNVEEIMPTLGNYLYYDFNENNDIEMLTETIIKRINSL